MPARVTGTRSTLPAAACLDEIGSTLEPVQNIHMPLILHHALKENRTWHAQVQPETEAHVSGLRHVRILKKVACVSRESDPA